MKWTPWLFGSLAAMFIAGCGGERRGDTGTTADTGTETGTMGDAGTASDTAIPGTDTARTGTSTGATSSDTARGGARITGDTNRPNPGTGATTGAGAPSDTARDVHDSAAGANH
jgi:hypothetical protein